MSEWRDLMPGPLRCLSMEMGWDEVVEFGMEASLTAWSLNGLRLVMGGKMGPKNRLYLVGLPRGVG